MHDLMDAADTVYSKAKNALGEIAVFVTPGRSVKTTRVGGDLYQSALRSNPHRLLAIYDCDVMLEWIEDDLEWAGREFPLLRS